MVTIFMGRIGHCMFTAGIYAATQRLPLCKDNRLKGTEWPDNDYGQKQVAV